MSFINDCSEIYFYELEDIQVSKLGQMFFLLSYVKYTFSVDLLSIAINKINSNSASYNLSPN